MRRGKGGKRVQGSNGILLWGAKNTSVNTRESKQIIDEANKIKHGQWGQRSQPGTRMNWIPAVGEATTLECSAESASEPKRDNGQKGWRSERLTSMIEDKSVVEAKSVA